ncbi:MAG: hypothetical protein ACTSYC_05730, partial [Promethearchaeota archaeon]
MGAQEIEIYNLSYSRTFNKVSSEMAPLESFSLYKVLAIYVYSKKKMYIWIGKNVANNLKIFIPNIRELFLEEFPEKRVSRTIIFMLKDQLKIIKTHSGLKLLGIEGFYEAELPFTNNFGADIEGVV